jgi:hypothetical protein
MRIIDLSVALKAGIVSDPPSMLPKIEYQDHKEGAAEFAAMFPGLKPERLPAGGRRWSRSRSPPTHEDRPRASRIVLRLRHWPRFPRQAGRPCMQDRRRQTRNRTTPSTACSSARRRVTDMVSPISSTRAAAWAAKQRSLFSGRACASPASTAGAGTRRFRSGANGSRHKPDLGGPQSRPRHRVLSHGEAHQPRSAAAIRIQGLLLPGKGRSGFGGLDLMRRAARRLSAPVPFASKRSCRHEPDERRGRG